MEGGASKLEGHWSPDLEVSGDQILVLRTHDLKRSEQVKTFLNIKLVREIKFCIKQSAVEHIFFGMILSIL
jgi:hypothetical protein